MLPKSAENRIMCWVTHACINTQQQCQGIAFIYLVDHTTHNCMAQGAVQQLQIPGRRSVGQARAPVDGAELGRHDAVQRVRQQLKRPVAQVPARMQQCQGQARDFKILPRLIVPAELVLCPVSGNLSSLSSFL